MELGIWSFLVSILGIGVDLVENARIEHSLDRFGERFLHRVFTAGEIEYSQSMKYPARHLAARFAAKEAVSKAFGTGIGKSMGWKDIDVRRKPSGEPYLVLEGGAKTLAAERQVSKLSISLSHTEHHAMAVVVVESAVSADEAR
ncbi:MAG: holo-[acyl-carrier protein] synthase [Verrucomicrobiota bacterium]|jgi:holo-[acyl-carrier protein] synthase